jgi:hypothetical protein
LPFTLEQFLEVFADYNQAVWPAQVGLAGLGVGLVLLSFFPKLMPPRLLPLGLGLLWTWMGAVYQLGFFRRINPLATGFGLAFLAQAGLFALWVMRRSPASFRPSHTPGAWMGGLLLLYAFVLYPKLATAFGHVYPARATFGLPCPTTIATLGILLWASPPPPWWVWIVPLGWSAIGASAAFLLGFREDFGLLLAAIGFLGVRASAWAALRFRASA